MNARLPIACLAVSLAACGSSPAAGPSRRTHACRPSGSRTLAADHQARVYSLHQNVYGCSFRVGKHYLLGAASRSIREARAGPIALAGDVVAYGLTTYGVDTVNAEVVVRRLGNGNQLKRVAATTNPTGPESSRSVDALVVKSDGAAAWIGAAGSIISHQRSDIEVHRADKRGRALLESSPTIDSTSLRLHGSTLTWKDGTQTRSATLR